MIATANLPTAWLNGSFVPLDQARISPLDRGFLFGDGVYEVIPCYNGRLFRLPQHLGRLQRSLDAIGLINPFSTDEWAQLLQDLVAQNGSGHQSVYLQISRGTPNKRDHHFCTDCPPTIFAYCTALEDPAGRTLESEAGVRCITCDDIRWGRCDIKSVALMANLLVGERARQAGCDEAIQIRSGWVTEGSASNVFVVYDGEILTPCAGPDVLGGITRDLVIELASGNSLALMESFIDPRLLQVADEIWITSATRGVRPVVELDGRQVSNGQPGPVWRKMAEIYAQYRLSLMA